MKPTKINLSDLFLKNKETGEYLSPDMLFINQYSDGGSASLLTTLRAVQSEWDIFLVPAFSDFGFKDKTGAIISDDDVLEKDGEHYRPMYNYPTNETLLWGRDGGVHELSSSDYAQYSILGKYEDLEHLFHLD